VKREAEELIAKLWNIISTVSKSAGQPHLKTKREQLKVVNESIQQLGHKKVPVPDDLPKLTKSLTDEIEQAEKDKVVLYFLKEQLLQMLAAIEGNASKRPPDKDTKPRQQTNHKVLPPDHPQSKHNTKGLGNSA